MLILYEKLKSAIDDFIDHGHSNGEFMYINAYLAATIHSIVDYAERFTIGTKESVLACKYANNTLKHDPSLVTHYSITGGMHFPMSFPLSIPEIEVVWKYDSSIVTRYKEQQKAFETLFAGKPIIKTLQPLVEQVDKG